jgi:murein L,D-transpeptidase YcbB/YkuD
MAPALQELGELGLPLPTYGFDGNLSGSDTLAEFRSNNQWYVAANPDRFQPAAVERMNEQQLGEVANTVYHESRHAEITFREARAQAGLGQDAAALMASMKLPQHIAEAAVAATDEALRGYDSYYGSGAAATQDTYTHGSYDQYRRLPEEDDAMEAGHKVSAEWRRFSGVRGTVERGDRGDDVSYLQRALTQQGVYHGSVDGDFGTATQVAVSEFQQHHGLKADGVCGERTWEALAAVYAE